ncbi:MAG: RloB domain-containing protein [Deltaproteobacteria bacterium]|nr:RloB domain-containing protein [Deltaproteobacteria bacterium]
MTRHGKRPGRRKWRVRQQRRKILIVCEGLVTEPEYFEWLKDYARNPLLKIEIVKAGGTASLVVKTAIERMAEKGTKSSKKRESGFDEVWAVFDRDYHPHFDDAVAKAEQNDIQCATSTPCFELWLLLHFEDQHAHASCRQITTRLRTHLHGYDKHIDKVAPTIWEEALGQACNRAKELRVMKEKGQIANNPNTQVDLLVERVLPDPGVAASNTDIINSRFT